MKRLISVIALVSCVLTAMAQEKVKLAFITDNHYSEGAQSVSDLKSVIRDINTQDDIDFVVLGGDLTDFGSDEEIAAVKTILDSLRHPYWALAGNHDAKWSESGCNTFKNVFGYESFDFSLGGWRFLGCNSGPDMRMTPALLPQETMVWLKGIKDDTKTIFFNHFPQDSSVLNYFDNVKEFKRIGVRAVIGGHWHVNRLLDYDGLPGILCRSAMASGNHPGYNIITLVGDHISVAERRVFDKGHVLFDPWYEKDLVKVEDTVKYDEHGLPEGYPWMRYDVNDRYTNVKPVWRIQDESNIVAGFAMKGSVAYYTTSSGCVRAISVKDGRQVWSVQLPGKIFSTPAVEGKALVLGCADGYIYALKTSNGSVLWKVKADKSVVASPVIFDSKVYIGASDGCFRCLDLKDGSEVWKYTEVQGFIECKPFVDADQVVFGTWANKLYSLDPKTGSLQWIWQCSKPSRMYSPAACVPVKSAGRIFVAVPDRKVYAIDAKTGVELFWADGGRESVGLSEDGRSVYAKTMFHRAYKFSADVEASVELPVSRQIWNVDNGSGYEISPTSIVEKDGMVIIPTDKGNLIALDAKDGSNIWNHKISIALVNPMSVWSSKGKTYILASTMDGVVTLLSVSR